MFYVHLVAFLFGSYDGVVKHPDATHLISHHDALIIDLHNLDRPVILGIIIHDVLDGRTILFGLIPPFQLVLSRGSLYLLLGLQIYDDLFIVGLLIEEIVMSCTEVNDIEICRDVELGLVELVKDAFLLADVVDLDLCVLLGPWGDKYS